MTDLTPEVIDALILFAQEHGKRCSMCDVRLATRSYVDTDGGALVRICDAAECAELWRCERCGTTGFTCSYCPQCGHTGIALATLEFTDAPCAAGLRYVNARDGRRGR
jgi:hypothetical protein